MKRPHYQEIADAELADALALERQPKTVTVYRIKTPQEAMNCRQMRTDRQPDIDRRNVHLAFWGAIAIAAASGVARVIWGV